MATITESISIARPVESVFAFAGDYRNDPQWRTGVVEMTVSPDAEIKAGSTTRELLYFAGKVYVTEADVVEWQPNQHTAFKSFAAAMPVEGERRFEETVTETRLTYNLTTYPQSLTDKLMIDAVLQTDAAGLAEVENAA
jgi:uncharacterized membrane protein